MKMVFSSFVKNNKAGIYLITVLGVLPISNLRANFQDINSIPYGQYWSSNNTVDQCWYPQ
jgi:hypothetical protein